MIKIKNWQLYSAFGSALTALADRKDLDANTKLRLIKIYREMETHLMDIEKVKESITKKHTSDKGEVKNTDLMESEIKSIMEGELVIDKQKLDIMKVVNLLSSKDLMVLEPILED